MAELFEPIAERFLKGELKSLVVVCPENERPLLGIGGYVDHLLKRPISQGLLAQFIKGTLGECTYVPVEYDNKTYSIFVVGCGPVNTAGKRAPLPTETLTKLAQNLKSMKQFPVGISRSDLGNLGEQEIVKFFKDLEVVIGA